MTTARPTQDTYTWLQGVQAGEVVTVIKVTPSARKSGKWAEVEVSGSPVQAVTATHIKVAGQQFRKASNANGKWGEAKSGDKIKPYDEMEFWQLKARLHKAHNDLSDMHAGIVWDGVKALLHALNNDSANTAVCKEIVNAVETVVRQRDALSELAQAVADQAEARAAAYWKEVAKK